MRTELTPSFGIFSVNQKIIFCEIMEQIIVLNVYKSKIREGMFLTI